MSKLSWSGSKMVPNKVVRDSVFHCRAIIKTRSSYMHDMGI